MCPSAQSGWIGRARWILAMRRCLLGGDRLVRLLATAQSVMPGGCKPIRQHREGLPARLTDSAPYPAALAMVIVPLTESPSMTDDRVFLTNRTSPRYGGPTESPRVEIVFCLWQCDKQNHGWREGPPLTVLCQSLDLLPGLHAPATSVSNEKRILLLVGGHEPLTSQHWPV